MAKCILVIIQLIPMCLAGVMKEHDVAFDNLLENYPAKGSRRFLCDANDSQLPLEIKIRMEIVTFEGINDLNEEMAFVGLIDLNWTDKMLRWNYENMSIWFQVSHHDIWTPNIAQENDPRNLFVLCENGKESKPLVNPAIGWVEWYPTGFFSTKCILDLTYFPFDKQKCKYSFTLWHENSDHVKLVPQINKPLVSYRGTDLELVGHLQSQIWTLLQVDTEFMEDYYESDGENYSKVVFTFNVQRRPSYYLFTVVLPIELLSLLQMGGLLQQQGQERTNFYVILLLTFWVILQGKKNAFILHTNYFFLF